MYDDNILYWIWLAEKCGAASKSFAKLIGRFENPFEIYRLEPEEIDAIEFIGDRLKGMLSVKSLERAYSVIKYCKKGNIDIITYGDKRYPSRLKTLEDPPIVLYCLGEFPDFDSKLCIGVVGTRKLSAYGVHSAYKISYELAAAGVNVISGMALGVDAVAACGAIEAGGRTVAVLGSGIDVIYPRQHKRLAGFIKNHGAVISEYPPAEPPYGSNFPKRNRIISGLSQGVLVVEGNRSSGSLITAKCAEGQGRELFALPGKINDDNSEGPNELIRKGANVALCSEDILDYYDFLYSDVIDRKALKNAKYTSDPPLGIFSKYGVDVEILRPLAKVERTQSEPYNPVRAKEEMPELPHEKKGGSGLDRSAEAVADLDPLSSRVFGLMPIDKAVSPDEMTEDGLSINDVMVCLSLLEIKGLVEALPGGKYIRK